MCRDAMKKGKCKLMEPVMKVDVLTPEDHMGDVIGDLNSRRGMVRLPPPCCSYYCAPL
jgi:elongation factor G